jgi:hypothetical protein
MRPVLEPPTSVLRRSDEAMNHTDNVQQDSVEQHPNHHRSHPKERPVRGAIGRPERIANHDRRTFSEVR